MGVPALIIVTILYLITSYEYIKRKDPGMAIAFFAYALANVGFIVNLIRTARA
jgi:hypothetical protein